jgi:hypothetical protein
MNAFHEFVFAFRLRSPFPEATEMAMSVRPNHSLNRTARRRRSRAVRSRPVSLVR